MNIFKDSTAFQIDKAGAIKVLSTSGWVGLAAAVTYLLGHLDSSVWGGWTPILAASLTILGKALSQWALPDASPTPKPLPTPAPNAPNDPIVIHIPQESK